MLAGVRHTAILVLALVLLGLATAACSSSPAESYCDRAVDYADYCDYENLIKEYTEAIRLNPDDAEAYVNRGVYYALLGKTKEAKRDLTKAIELGLK